MDKISRPKRHHYNAEMLQERFVDQKGRLYYFDKRSESKGVITGNPKNFFLETNLYTFEHKDGTKETFLEEKFAWLEGVANHIIEKIVTAARLGQKPNLTDKERGLWNSFFYYQWKRSPDFFRRVPSLADFDETFLKAISEIESRRSLTEEERRDLEDPATKERIKQGATVFALADGGTLVQKVLWQKGLCVLVIKKPNKSFVLGSRPVLSYIPQGSNLMDPKAEVWLPVAYDVMVGPAPISSAEEQVIETRDDSRIRYINEAIFKQSKAIAGRSKELISSLTRYR